MINAFLFDLDGTLLPMEMEMFEKEYFMKLAYRLSSHFEPSELVKYVWHSTNKMIRNTGGTKTNKEVFFEDFASITGKDMSILQPIFDNFYLNEFKELRSITKSHLIVIKTIELLISKGYEIVVATNPIFPMQAIRERIKWTGLDEKVFKYITCFEEMHYCKPNVEFYQEVLNVINKKPQECIMVGNDAQEDLAASQVGIKTFLVEEYLINREDSLPYCDYRGNYNDLYDFARSLPTLVEQVRESNIL